MIKNLENNLYIRVGYTKKSNQVEDLKINDEDLINGTEVSVINNFILNNYLLGIRKLVLKTSLGYIPVSNINNLKDITAGEYLKDKTFYIKKYDHNIDEEYNEDVKKLMLKLK